MFPERRNGRRLQRLAGFEFGGTPRLAPEAWADRSPIDYARTLAFSRVPLELWWSRRDRVVVDQASQSGLLFRAIKRINPRAPVVQVVGTWQHTAEMRPLGRLPLALAWIGLLPISHTAVREGHGHLVAQDGPRACGSVSPGCVESTVKAVGG
jgi:hypothetical protein